VAYQKLAKQSAWQPKRKHRLANLRLWRLKSAASAHRMQLIGWRLKAGWQLAWLAMA